MSDLFFDDFADMSELVDADIDRVDLVGKAANGHRFILAKSGEGNLFRADMVRELIKNTEENTMTDDELAKADLDASTILAEPIDSVEGDSTMPGSPAWEAVDAATAAKWTAILVRAKNAVCELLEREKAEVDAGMDWDEDGIDDLKEVEAAVEYAISLLAPFAAEEAGEVVWESMEAIEKAVKGIKARALSTVEQYGPILKAGRTLSTANETSLRAAVDNIKKVLDSLPKAPVSQVEGESNLGSETEDAGKASIEKDRVAEIVEDAIAKADAPAEDAPADDEAPAEDIQVTDDTEKEADMMKAEGDMGSMSDDELARMAITGVDSERQAALQEIGLRTLTGAGNLAEEIVEETPEEEAAEEMTELNEEDGEITEPAESDNEPAPASEVGTSASVTKSDLTSEKKNKKAKVVKAALEEQERLVAVIKGLEDRIAHLEAPAASKVLTNGALPPAHLMRGQDAGASAMSDAVALRKERDNADTAVIKAEVEEKMRISALEALAAMSNH